MLAVACYIVGAILAVNIATVALCVWWVRRTPHREPLPVAIDAAVKDAYADLGLPLEQFAMTRDLVSTGKVYAILYRAAETLGKDHELRTAQDVADWLAVAPAKKA